MNMSTEQNTILHKNKKPINVSLYILNCRHIFTVWLFHQRPSFTISTKHNTESFMSLWGQYSIHPVSQSMWGNIELTAFQSWLSTTSGSEQRLCWLRPSCAAQTSSWSRYPPARMLPAAPGRASHTCVFVCVCYPCTLWSSTSWRGSGVGSPKEGWAPEPNRIRSEAYVYALMEHDQPYMRAVLPYFSPGRTFLLSVCWPVRQWAYSSPEPCERSHRGYTRSLPFPPLELCGISPPVSSLCAPESGRRMRNCDHSVTIQSQQQIFRLHFRRVLFFCFFFQITCAKMSLAKTLFPCFIIMLTNLLKNKVSKDQWLKSLQ